MVPSDEKRKKSTVHLLCSAGCFSTMACVTNSNMEGTCSCFCGPDTRTFTVPVVSLGEGPLLHSSPCPQRLQTPRKQGLRTHAVTQERNILPTFRFAQQKKGEGPGATRKIPACLCVRSASRSEFPHQQLQRHLRTLGNKYLGI